MNQFLLRMRGRRMAGGRGLAIVGTLSLTIFLGASATLEAAPVTFRFEAEITSIDRSPDAMFDLPSNVMTGDTFSGLLQFEPFAFGQSDESSSLKVNLGSEVFSVEDAPLTTANEVFALDPIGVYSIRNIVRIGCTGLSSLRPCNAFLSSSSNDTQLADLGLFGATAREISEVLGEGLISQGESLGDVEVWSRLMTRRIFMNFTSNSSPGSIQLEAVFGPMVVIPEPSSLSLILIGISGLTRQFLRRK